MAFVGTFFAAVGRFAVRFRWAIILAWLAGSAAAMVGLPSLSSVTQSDNTSFLPASAPSEMATALASPLQGASLTAVTVVVARSGGPLTGADRGLHLRTELPLPPVQGQQQLGSQPRPLNSHRPIVIITTPVLRPGPV